jgi:predicted permease
MIRLRERVLAWLARRLPADIAQAAAGDLEEDWRRARHLPRRRRVWRFVREAAALAWCAIASRAERDVPAERRRGAMLQGFWHDLRYAVRLAAREPKTTATCVLTLTLGLGSSLALFSLTNAWLLRPLPFRDADRLVAVWETIPSASIFENTPAPVVLHEWRARAQSFSGLAALTVGTANLSGDGDPERLSVILAEPELLALLGVHPVLGAGFASAPNAPAQVMLTFEFWQRRFGGAPDVVDRVLTIDGAAAAIAGVLPPRMPIMSLTADVWRPLRFTEAERASGSRSLWVIGRLRDGVTVDAASREVEAIARSRGEGDGGLGARAVALQDQTVGTLASDLPVLLAATGLLLLIACANVASLLLARASARRAEFTLRAALGAGRLRIARQVITEALPLALAGAAAGLVFGGWMVRGFQALLPQAATLAVARISDPRVFLFGLAAALLAAVLFSVAPAMHGISRRAFTALRAGGTRSVTAGQWLLRGLAGLEIALAVALLIAAAAVGRSFIKLSRADLGLQYDQVVTFELPRAGGHDAGVAFFDELLRRLAETPGIESAALTQALPLKSSCCGSSFPVVGAAPGVRPVLSYWRTVNGGYFRTLGIPLLEGRAFDARDRAGAGRVAIVSASYARRTFPAGTSAIGQRIGWATTETPMTVVGVVADVRLSGAAAPSPHVYMPYAQVERLPTTLAVKSSLDTARAIDAVRRTVWTIDPLQPVAEARPMADLLWRQLARRRFQLALWTGFAAAAGGLALLGVYGIVSFLVRHQRQELGIRLALGARPATIARLVVRQGAVPAVAGTTAGMGIAYLSARFVSGFVVGVDPRDPRLYAAVAIAVLLAAAAAMAPPARRAARLDPVDTLRD